MHARIRRITQLLITIRTTIHGVRAGSTADPILASILADTTAVNITGIATETTSTLMAQPATTVAELTAECGALAVTPPQVIVVVAFTGVVTRAVAGTDTDFPLAKMPRCDGY